MAQVLPFLNQLENKHRNNLGRLFQFCEVMFYLAARLFLKNSVKRFLVWLEARVLEPPCRASPEYFREEKTA